MGGVTFLIDMQGGIKHAEAFNKRKPDMTSLYVILKKKKKKKKKKTFLHHGQTPKNFDVKQNITEVIIDNSTITPNELL